VPSFVFALTAVVGGVIEGAGFGSAFALAAFLPEQLFHPASAGGTGSPGLTATAVTIGLAVGIVTGGVMGIAAGLGLLLAWRLRPTPICAVVAGSSAVALVLGGILVAVPGDPKLYALVAIAWPHAVAGVALIDGWRRAARRSPS
jgi:hypothetical protein